MLDIRWIRDNPTLLETALVNRGTRREAAKAQVDKLVSLDMRRRSIAAQMQEWQERRNRLSKEIGDAKAAKDEALASALMAQVSRLKSDITNASEKLEAQATRDLEAELALVPNVPLDDVPIGADEHANVEYRRFGSVPAIASPKEHYELGEALKQMDFEAAAKLSGSRFTVLKKGLARLERALGQFMLDLHTQPEKDGLFGYTEVQPPILVRDEAMFGTAQLPKFREDQFVALTSGLSRDARLSLTEEELRLRTRDGAAIDQSDAAGKLFEMVKAAVSDSPASDERKETLRKFLDEFWLAGFKAELSLSDLKKFEAKVEALFHDSLWLIPTAEVPLTNLVRESIVAEEELPLRFTALTPCFRSEAGAAGRDTRGMLRQHQFDKVELVSITTPEQSKDEHERMLTCAEEVLKRLGLHYRVMTLSTGDMGFASQKTYDIEVWLPGQGAFREISSCSVCGDFQARRMQARFRPKEGKNVRLVHTLNGSGVAVGRALIAVMENYQNPDGSITVPDALRKYMGGVEKIEAVGGRQ